MLLVPPMKPFRALVPALILSALACCTATPGPAPEDPTQPTKNPDLFPYEYHVDDLQNGLRLITIPTDYPDLVALHIVVRTGSRNEIEDGKSGFAHFFEHMMFRGSKNISADEQARIFKEAGADRNAYTTDDYTNYHTTFAKEDLETVLRVEADRFRHLQYSRKVFRTESQAVFGEYNKNSANPVRQILETVRDTAFQVHPYKHTTMGFLRDIVTMPLQYDYSRTFFERWYKPEYISVVLTGDVSQEQTKALVERYFGDWKRGSHVVAIPLEPEQKEPLTCHVKWRTPTQPWLTIAFRGPAFSLDDKDMPTLDVLASIAFSQNSELFKKLYVKERKIDVLFTDFVDHIDPYLLNILVRLKDPKDLAYVRDCVLSTCDALKKKLVSEHRLAAVKANLKYSFASSLDSSANIASNLAGYIARTGSPAIINKLYQTYDSVTAEDVQRVARKYLDATSRTVCTLLQAEAPDLGEPVLADVPLEPAVANGTTGEDNAPRLVLDPAAADPKPAVLMRSQSPLVTFRMVFPTGAIHDPKGKEGLANVTAQMLVSAATKRRSFEQIIAAQFPMAAGINVSVDKQMTVFSGSVHRDNLVKYYELLLEVLTQPAFLQADLDRIKSNTVSAIDAGLRRSDDEETGKEVLYQEIYAGHPFGHLNRGTIEGVERITIEDVKKFYAARFRRAYLGLSGGYPKGFPARVAADLRAAFGASIDIEGEKHDFRQGIRPIAENRLTIVEKDTRATGIHLGFPIDVTRANDDFVALWLVRSYFGEHRSENSYLYRRLREIRGLNYGDYAYIEYFPGGGGQFQPDPNLARTSQIFQVWIRPVPPVNGPFAFKAMNYELRKLVENGMSKEDFEATRTYLRKYVNILVASQDRQLGYAIDSRFYNIGPFAQHIKKGLARLTLSEVNRVIRKYLRSDRLQYVVITKDAKGFRDQILGAQPTPITYTSTPGKAILDEDKIIERLKIDLQPDQIKIVPIDQVFGR